MNKRARTRLAIVALTLVGLLALGWFVIGNGTTQGAVYRTIKDISAKQSDLAGKRVKVGGSVVPGSWNKQSNPMKFTIRDEADKTGTGPTLKVVYTGTAPNTFGDGVVAIVTGTLQPDGSVQAGEMITKCPSKYESASGAIPVADLIGKGAAMSGKPVKATGYVKAGSIASATSGDRLIVAEKADGTGKTVAVTFSGALPSGLKDGSQVVISGELDSNGKFVATSVALEQGQK